MTNILLVKLGALGDVLRTTSLVAGLKKKWPDARVTWIVLENGMPLLCRNAELAEIFSIDSRQTPHPMTRIAKTEWDVVINLDEDPQATALAASVRAKEKFGVGRDRHGSLVPLAPESQVLITLATNDRLKFRENQMPFQALIYQAVGMTWAGEPYVFVPPPDAAERRKRIFSETGNPARIGLFVGASERYANKFWSEDEISNFCSAAPPNIFLFGGPAESARLKSLARREACRARPFIAIQTLDDMAAVVAGCDLLICGDTLVMHLGQAMNVPMIVLFGPTSHTEIVIRGRKIVSPYACGPCYLRACDIQPSCMSAISPERVLRTMADII